MNGFLNLDTVAYTQDFTSNPAILSFRNGTLGTNPYVSLMAFGSPSGSGSQKDMILGATPSSLDTPSSNVSNNSVFGSNLGVNLANTSVDIALDDIRTSAALQQYYEILGRGGGRYREFINSFLVLISIILSMIFPRASVTSVVNWICSRLLRLLQVLPVLLLVPLKAI